MSSSAFAYLAVGPNHDPIWAAGNTLTGIEAVAQAILTRLNMFLGEWWENLNLGLPVFQQIISQLGSQRGLAAMQVSVTQNVLGTPYVTAVTSVEVTFKAGQLGFVIVAQTAFGTVTVTNLPGASAALPEGS